MRVKWNSGSIQEPVVATGELHSTVFVPSTGIVGIILLDNGDLTSIPVYLLSGIKKVKKVNV